MNFKSFEEILHFAIDKEKEAQNFYEEASRQEPYSGGKETFKEFAAEEKKHQVLLEGYLKGVKKISDYQFVKLPDLKRSDYMVDLSYEKGMPYRDMLRLAMKREEKSLKLYEDLKAKAGDEDLRKLFHVLSQEEAKHKLSLERLYDDLMAVLGD